MDFNHFIKIKIINYEDNSKSEYINGIVLSKNIADKRMNTKIANPKILLVKDSISTDSSEGT
jgi:chaperonin GroEL (HSP60 family)